MEIQRGFEPRKNRGRQNTTVQEYRVKGGVPVQKLILNLLWSLKFLNRKIVTKAKPGARKLNGRRYFSKLLRISTSSYLTSQGLRNSFKVRKADFSIVVGNSTKSPQFVAIHHRNRSFLASYNQAKFKTESNADQSSDRNKVLLHKFSLNRIALI